MTRRFRGAARLNRSPKRRPGSRAAHRCSLACILTTANSAGSNSGQDTAPVFTGASSDITIPSLTDTLPSFPMYAALPRPEYYDGAAPPAPSAGVAPIPAPPLRSRSGTWSARGWFPRSLSSDQRVRHPALPLRHRHGYAVDLHRGLQTQAKQTQPEVPLPLAAGRVRTANQPESTGFRAGIRSRGVTKPISHVYLPVSLTAPAPSGSAGTTRLRRGCSHPRHRPAAQAASSFTPPLRRQSHGGLTPPSGQTTPRGARFSRIPSRLAHRARPGSTGTTLLRQGSSRPPRRPAAQAASSFTPPLRRPGDRGLPPPSGQTAPRGALVAHVVAEVAVDDDGAELEDGLGAVGRPPGSCNAESVFGTKRQASSIIPVAMGQPLARALS